MYEEYLKTETEVIHDELEHTPDVNAVSTSSRCVCFDQLQELLPQVVTVEAETVSEPKTSV